ncbi:hypothetical protein IFT47_27070 [Pseudomonas sp. CFBP 13711]|uniref:hypothetical protein n=1 Tax=unclassified Pseudomonas TaxID=196821 RepID=UPI00177D2FAB|nr:MULTISPECIES: hypothetical protein [unclassified Pseudomonas]MBD8710284.1 hypothetical protein [Pseudomonas sp. CFBP 13711]MBD8715589.1 hypothetical protein [Pseudomonas sp. CFBP 13715]
MRVSGQQPPVSSASIELQQRSNSTAATGHASVGQGHPQSAEVSAAALNQAQSMKHLLTTYVSNQFQPYKDRLDPESGHQREIDRIIESRVNKLMEENISFQELGTLMEKAEKMDRNASMVSGTTGGVPFAVASSLQAAIPVITGIGANIQNPVAKAAALGTISLAAASAMDQVGGASIKKLREDAYYLHAPADKLHESLNAALATIDTTANLAIQNAKEAQTFTIRNGIRTVVGPVVAAINPKAEPIVDTAIAIAGGLAAGTGTGYLANSRRTEQGTSGPALLLGRRDAEAKEDLSQETEWIDALKALRDAKTVRTPLANGVGRLADAGRTLITDPLGAVSRTAKATFTPSGAANVSTLTAGFTALEAGKGAAVNALSKQHPALSSFAKHAVNTVGGSVVFGSNAAGVAVGDKLVDDFKSRRKTTAEPTTGATETAQSVHEDLADAPETLGEEPGRVSRPSSQRSQRAGSDSGSLPRTSLTGNRITNAENSAPASTKSRVGSARASLKGEQAQPTISGGPSSEAVRPGSASSAAPAPLQVQTPVPVDDSSDDDASYHTATSGSSDNGSVYHTPPQTPA